MSTAHAIAKCFLVLAEKEQEFEPMTHLRIQKLVYYAQGWSLALRNAPLMATSIEAWREGPVTPALWDSFKGFGNQPINSSIGQLEMVRELPSDDNAFVRSIWEGYKEFSATGLSEKTHTEKPWKDAYKPDSCGRCKALISNESMKRFFLKEYELWQPETTYDPDAGRLPGRSLDRIRAAELEIREGKTTKLQDAFAA